MLIICDCCILATDPWWRLDLGETKDVVALEVTNSAKPDVCKSKQLTHSGKHNYTVCVSINSFGKKSLLHLHLDTIFLRTTHDFSTHEI